MYALAILAFAAGLILGVFFRVLAVVAVAFGFVLGFLLFGRDSGIPFVSGTVVFTVLVNVGFMAGAVVSHRRTSSSDPDPTEK